MRKSLIKVNHEPLNIEITNSKKQSDILISPSLKINAPIPLLMINQPEFIALKPTNVNFPLQFEVWTAESMKFNLPKIKKFRTRNKLTNLNSYDD